ncbi:MAG: TonB-dependent siderophore receptor [Beijerinckiaceae bacterium]|nr:TonB-dependent siderophore receptor [Beijerinckiaceae bacterium]
MNRRITIALLLASGSPAAYAQTVGGGGSLALPEIVIDTGVKFDPNAGKFNGAIGETSDVAGINKPILDIPRSVYVVTPQTLQQQMPQSLAEAVESIPGTFIGQTNGGNSDFITIKGFQVSTTDAFLVGNNNGLLVDGIRAPYDRAFNANTQSIELLSGPASYMYGYASEGGVLNLTRKLPLPDAHYSVDLLGGAVTGSFKDIAGSFDFTGPLYKSTEGVLAYRLVGSGAQDQPWRIGDTVSRDFLMAPTFAWYSDVLTATIAYEHGKNQQPYDRGDTSLNGAPLSIPRTESLTEPFSTYDEKVDWVHGKIDYNLNKDTDFHVRYSYSSTNMVFNEVRSDHQSDFNPATGQLSQYLYTNAPAGGATTDQGLISASGVHRFDTGAFHHEFQAGIDYYSARTIEANEYESTSVDNFNVYNPVYNQFNPAAVFNLGSLIGLSPNSPISVQKSRELGIFGQDAITYGPLTLTGGGRYAEIYQYERYFGGIDTNNTAHTFLPSASALYKINANTALFADYAQSYNPNIYAVGLGTNLKFAGPILPETGTGYEAGIKAKFLDGNILAQASVFRIDKTNVQTENQAGDLTFAQAQRSEGAALSVLGRLTPNIDVKVAYSHQHVVVTGDDPIQNDVGNQVINAPSDTFFVSSTYHFLEGPLNHLSVTADVNGATKNAVDSQNSFFLPGFAVADVGFSYDYKPRPDSPLTRLSFKIANVFDTTYYPATGSKTNWITVGQPRTFLLDLSVSL